MLFITLAITTLLSRTSSASSISSVSTRNLQQQNLAGSPWISVNFTLANGTTYTDISEAVTYISACRSIPTDLLSNRNDAFSELLVPAISINITAAEIDFWYIADCPNTRPDTFGPIAGYADFYPAIPLVGNMGDNNVANYMSYKPRLYDPSAPYASIYGSFNSQCNDSSSSISGSFFDSTVTSLVNGSCVSLSPGSGFTEAGCTNTQTFDISAFNHTQVSFWWNNDQCLGTPSTGPSQCYINQEASLNVLPVSNYTTPGSMMLHTC
jgi:hypothetical protein